MYAVQSIVLGDIASYSAKLSVEEEEKINLEGTLSETAIVIQPPRLPLLRCRQHSWEGAIQHHSHHSLNLFSVTQIASSP